MNSKEFINQMKKKDLKSVYLFFGEEVYILDYTIDKLKETIVDKSLEALNYLYLEGSEIEFDNILNACETLPFMSEKKLVIVNDLPHLMKGQKRGSDSSNKMDINTLSEYMLKLDDYLVLVFIVKHSEINKSNPLYRAIKKNGDLVEFKKIRGAELDRWIESKFKKHNKTISKSNINHFIQRSSYFDTKQNKTLYDLENEIIKISNYMIKNVTVSNEIIDLLMAKSLEMNIFSLLSSISSKNGDNAIRTFNEMYMSNEPVLLILHMIVRQLRNMLSYKILRDKGYTDGDIVAKIGISEYEYKKVAAQSNNFTVSQLEKAMYQCLETEKLLKTSSVNQRLALEVLITNLCYEL